MKKAYDRTHAQQLVPLLRSIGIELTERLHEIRVLQGRLAAQERLDAPAEAVADLNAALSNHYRELRLAQRELQRLGCTLDDNHPLRILIPGADGEVAHGFALDADNTTLRRVSTGTALG